MNSFIYFHQLFVWFYLFMFSISLFFSLISLMDLIIFSLRTLILFIKLILRSFSCLLTVLASCNRITGLLWWHITITVLSCLLTLASRHVGLVWFRSMFKYLSFLCWNDVLFLGFWFLSCLLVRLAWSRLESLSLSWLLEF